MNFWIFAVTEHEENGCIYAPEQIFRQRMTDKFWGLGERTPNRSSLEEGDRVVWYIGRPVKAFWGSGILASDSFPTTADQRKQLSHGTNFYSAAYGVLLEEIQVWDRPITVDSVLPRLRFIENKKNWGAYFQGGVRQVSEEDFRTATGTGLTTSVPVEPAEGSLERASEFALEVHLEEFIDRNWDGINFGSRLVRYRSEEQDGRQFPAGPWSIDFLCVEPATGGFVVVELKKGKTSDAVVGQILRYMGWVRDNLAKADQKVKGIIISKDVDDALDYAVRYLPDVSVLTYRVDFSLSPFKKEVPHP